MSNLTIVIDSVLTGLAYIGAAYLLWEVFFS